jgi:hypothetical protein
MGVFTRHTKIPKPSRTNSLAPIVENLSGLLAPNNAVSIGAIGIFPGAN